MRKSKKILYSLIFGGVVTTTAVTVPVAVVYSQKSSKNINAEWNRAEIQKDAILYKDAKSLDDAINKQGKKLWKDWIKGNSEGIVDVTVSDAKKAYYDSSQGRTIDLLELTASVADGYEFNESEQKVLVVYDGAPASGNWISKSLIQKIVSKNYKSIDELNAALNSEKGVTSLDWRNLFYDNPATIGITGVTASEDNTQKQNLLLKAIVDEKFDQVNVPERYLSVVWKDTPAVGEWKSDADIKHLIASQYTDIKTLNDYLNKDQGWKSLFKDVNSIKGISGVTAQVGSSDTNIKLVAKLELGYIFKDQSKLLDVVWKGTKVNATWKTDQEIQSLIAKNYENVTDFNMDLSSIDGLQKIFNGDTTGIKSVVVNEKPLNSLNFEVNLANGYVLDGKPKELSVVWKNTPVTATWKKDSEIKKIITEKYTDINKLNSALSADKGLEILFNGSTVGIDKVVAEVSNNNNVLFKATLEEGYVFSELTKELTVLWKDTPIAATWKTDQEIQSLIANNYRNITDLNEAMLIRGEWITFFNSDTTGIKNVAATEYELNKIRLTVQLENGYVFNHTTNDLDVIWKDTPAVATWKSNAEIKTLVANNYPNISELNKALIDENHWTKLFEESTTGIKRVVANEFKINEVTFTAELETGYQFKELTKTVNVIWNNTSVVASWKSDADIQNFISTNYTDAGKLNFALSNKKNWKHFFNSDTTGIKSVTANEHKLNVITFTVTLENGYVFEHTTNVLDVVWKDTPAVATWKSNAEIKTLVANNYPNISELNKALIDENHWTKLFEESTTGIKRVVANEFKINEVTFTAELETGYQFKELTKTVNVIWNNTPAIGTWKSDSEIQKLITENHKDILSFNNALTDNDGWKKLFESTTTTGIKGVIAHETNSNKIILEVILEEGYAFSESKKELDVVWKDTIVTAKWKTDQEIKKIVAGSYTDISSLNLEFSGNTENWKQLFTGDTSGIRTIYASENVLNEITFTAELKNGYIFNNASHKVKNVLWKNTPAIGIWKSDSEIQKLITENADNFHVLNNWLGQNNNWKKFFDKETTNGIKGISASEIIQNKVTLKVVLEEGYAFSESTKELDVVWKNTAVTAKWKTDAQIIKLIANNYSDITSLNLALNEKNNLNKFFDGNTTGIKNVIANGDLLDKVTFTVELEKGYIFENSTKSLNVIWNGTPASASWKSDDEIIKIVSDKHSDINGLNLWLADNDNWKQLFTQTETVGIKNVVAHEDHNNKITFKITLDDGYTFKEMTKVITIVWKTTTV